VLPFVSAWFSRAGVSQFQWYLQLWGEGGTVPFKLKKANDCTVAMKISDFPLKFTHLSSNLSYGVAFWNEAWD